jgi:transposase
MVVVGADVHKRTHTFVAVDEVGRKLAEKMVAATSCGHAEAVMWARDRFGVEVVWAIEDCRHLSARLGHQLRRHPHHLLTRRSAGHAPDPGFGTHQRQV